MEKHQRVIFTGNISKFNELPDDLTKYIYINFINEDINKLIWNKLKRTISQLLQINMSLNSLIHSKVSSKIINIFKDEIFKIDINFSLKVLNDILENYYQNCIPLSLFVENVLLENKELINYLIKNKEKNITNFECFEKLYNYYKEGKKYYEKMTLEESMSMMWIMYIYH